MRFDTALYQDYKIPPYYDSMIGKLVVYAKTREEAIRKLQAALCELVIEGVKQGAVHIEEYRVHNPSFRHLADDSTAGPRHIFAHPPCARITLH